jgi:hypothetical protein
LSAASFYLTGPHGGATNRAVNLLYSSRLLFGAKFNFPGCFCGIGNQGGDLLVPASYFFEVM